MSCDSSCLLLKCVCVCVAVVLVLQALREAFCEYWKSDGFYIALMRVGHKTGKAWPGTRLKRDKAGLD